MSKFNKPTARPAVTSPVTTVSDAPDAVTHEGAPAFTRDAKSELFLLGVSNLVGEDTFYESATERDARFAALVQTVALTDLAWLVEFGAWLRGPDANLRSAPAVLAAEAVRAWTARAMIDGQPLGEPVARQLRELVSRVLQRADEPGELLAYWTSQYGLALPKPLKRGVAEAVTRLYDEYGVAKYDSDGKAFRMGRVLDLTHPSPRDAAQGALFKHALDRLHNRADEVPAELEMLNVRARLMATPVGERRALLTSVDGPTTIKRAGLTWEALAGWLQGPMDDRAWETVIPSMGYMALLRNLRNLDEAGVADGVAKAVADRLSDPAQVAKSRQLPFRFYSAYQAAPSDRWKHALSQALGHCLRNVPYLGGRTLVLVDTSGSMTTGGFSKRSTVTPAVAAAIFGAALQLRGERVDLYGFADGVFKHELRKGQGLLGAVSDFTRRFGEVGAGTQIAASLRATYTGQDRVIVISDMQTMDDAGELLNYGGYNYGYFTAQPQPGAVPLPAHVPVYGFNLGGYRATVVPSRRPHRHEFGGLTDATFRMLPLLERGASASWPWETKA